MRYLFCETGFLDKQAVNNGLSEDILMENAAAALEAAVTDALEKRINSLPPLFCSNAQLTVLVVCGSGNNGGDGYALARRIHRKKLSRDCFAQAVIYAAKPPKTGACILQAGRAAKYGIPIYGTSPQSADNPHQQNLSQFTELSRSCAALADCLFGSGLSGKPDEQSEKFIRIMNEARKQNPVCFFLSCDIPSGLTASGEIPGTVFEADRTIVMGAYKLALFSDAAKDCAGVMSVADLGISRTLFENGGTTSGGIPDSEQNQNKSRVFLLEKSDLRLPVRHKQNVHKGTFGHAAVLAGDKPGAANLACQSAFLLGAGLVSAVHTQPQATLSGQRLPSENFPPEIMHTNSLPAGETALCAGMGFGRENPAADSLFYYAAENPDIACVIDADLLHHPKLPELLGKRGNLVLTPHPKEFAALLKNCGFGSFTAPQIAARRFDLASAFCASYPEITLLLKGANTLICDNAAIFVNTFGSSNLAKGGSGDILAGFIVSLLAQGYTPRDAAVNGSLIHALAAQKAGGTYSLTPKALLKAAKKMEHSAHA